MFVVELAYVDGTMGSEEEDVVHRVHKATDRVFRHIENENARPHIGVSIAIEEWREGDERMGKTGYSTLSVTGRRPTSTEGSDSPTT